MQPYQHDRNRWPSQELQRFGGPAHELSESFIDNFDHLLSRVERLRNLGAHSANAYAADKILDHAVMNVRIQQRKAHLAHGVIERGAFVVAVDRQQPRDLGRL